VNLRIWLTSSAETGGFNNDPAIWIETSAHDSEGIDITPDSRLKTVYTRQA